MKKWMALVLFVVLVLLSVGCTAKDDSTSISSAQVESISVWAGYSGDEKQLTKQETKTFIQLYNQSQHMGKANGNGGTPEWGVRVSFKNGDVLCINEFNGREDFEVSWYTADGMKAWCYINNQELMDFITEIIETMD